ncbi:hypothetical protein [Deinococcus enclensis]|uniref:Spore coat protein U (SCPU) domain-containing protein n=1 Tax=Deinococcus enclensis TaxID=1049582 RepID=A0ABT9MFX1_9DEIO|nr:hypothetical protein [Deinococcus enclensis]MDP9765502.1 hypothetical protein [Deinococcus enclensis]
MKNLMTLAAALLVSAPAVAGSATMSVNFSAVVSNTCHVSGQGSALSGSAGPVPATVANYTALGATSSSAIGAGFIIECTKGTDVTVTATPTDGTATTVASYGVASTPAAMKLFKGSDFLNGLYTIQVNRQDSASQTSGDLYGGSVSYTPTAGQWGAPKGTYNSILTITFEYN